MSTPASQPFSRYIVPDQTTNRAVQDIYDKIALISTQISNLQSQVTTLQAQVKQLLSP